MVIWITFEVIDFFLVRAKWLLINDVMQIGGCGSYFCDTYEIYKLISHFTITEREGARKSLKLRDII